MTFARPFPGAAPDGGAQIDDASFQRLAALVHAESGIVLSDSKRGLVVSRLSRRLRELQLDGFPAYCRFLEEQGGAEERQSLISLLTTNVTRFFREHHHFDALRREVLPPLITRAQGGGRVRIWSAGCSTGEEPYSIAICLLELFPGAGDHDIRILGTDIDPNVIRTAKDAVYANIDDGHLPAALRGRYFDASDGAPTRLSVRPEVRRLVTLGELNLLQDWPMAGPFDVIFCRNVVIYFDAPTQARLWTRFTDILAPGGYLFLGHSERADTASERRLVSTGITQYRRVRAEPGRDLIGQRERTMQ